jgi:putative sigma-54 modulation protein
MNISITFRQMDASAAIKAYARDKVAKLQKFLRQPMTARVTLSLDKLRHVAEARISSGGRHLEAKEQSQDMYASIDKMIDKLERQIRGAKGAAQAKARRGGATLRGGTRPTPLQAPAERESRATGTKSKAKKKPAKSKVKARAEAKSTPKVKAKGRKAATSRKTKIR